MEDKRDREQLKKDFDSLLYQYWHDTAKLHYEYGEKLRAVATLKDGWGMGIPEADEYCKTHFEFRKLKTDPNSLLENYRKDHGLVAIIRPVYYGLADDRSRMFEAMVWDTTDVEAFGTDEHGHDDVGYKIHFICDEEEFTDKLFPTYYAAELGCIEKIKQILKEKQ